MSAYSNGPELDRLHAPQREKQEDRLLEPLVDDDLVGGRVDLGHAGLARVEQLDGLGRPAAAASASAGESSLRRSHNSSMLACRSAMAHPSEALPHQRQPLHGLDQRHPHVPRATLPVELPGLTRIPPSSASASAMAQRVAASGPAGTGTHR